MKKLLVLAMLLVTTAPMAHAACVTNYHHLSADAGYRRYKVVDGRKCWYNEGHRHEARAQVIRAPKPHNNKPRPRYEDAPVPPQPPPAVIAPTATADRWELSAAQPVARVVQAFNDLPPPSPRRITIGAGLPSADWRDNSLSALLSKPKFNAFPQSLAAPAPAPAVCMAKAAQSSASVILFAAVLAGWLAFGLGRLFVPQPETWWSS